MLPLLTLFFLAAACGTEQPQKEPVICGQDGGTSGGPKVSGVIDLGSDCLVPGFMLVHEERVYVTCGGTSGENEGRLAIIDLAELSVERSVHLGGMPGALLVSEDRLLIGDGSDGRLFMTTLSGEVLHDHEDPIVLCPSDWEGGIYQFISGLAEAPGGELLASCFSTSEVVRFSYAEDEGDEETGARHVHVGERVTTGDGAGSIARWGAGAAVVLDALAGTATKLDLSGTMEADIGRWTVGDTPNDIVIEGDAAFVVSSTFQTLQVLDLSLPPEHATIDEIFIGDNTNPMNVALVDGGKALVSLLLADEVALIDLEAGFPTACVSLPSGEELLPLPEKSPLARPQSVVSIGGGRALVALNNLDADWQPAGHGIVAVIDLGASD